MNTNPIIRHGDVLLVPARRQKNATAKPGLILAEGEATGHAHRIEGDASLIESGGTTYLDARRTVALLHEEHARVEIAPGIYEIVHQHEFAPAPFMPSHRRVVD